MIIDMEHNNLTQASINAGEESSSNILKSDKIAETQERFIAFLDIMGFKDRVARNNHEEVLHELEQSQIVLLSQYSQMPLTTKSHCQNL